ncbi:chain length determinant protein [Thioploca ingrica]|uniref:Chain length determinant protein n=1 Tax=Thioploca ingrica TaxID=40754 RepID=A0A090AF29_9GAMM|nr:chain length determinant protein [Thioploca ingrica]
MLPQSSSGVVEQSIPTGRFKPLVSLLRYKWLALFILLGVSAIGIEVFSTMGVPIYQAVAIIWVSPRFTPNLETDKTMDLDRTEYPFYVKQQASLVTRPDVIHEALQTPQLRENWFLPGEDESSAKQRLKDALDVDNKRNEPSVTVKLSSEQAKGLGTVLNTLIEVYLKKTQEENIFDSSGRIKWLEQHRQELEQLLATKEQQRTQIAIELGVTTFQENSLNPYDNILVESRQAQVLAHRDSVKTENQLATLNKKQSNGDTILDILVAEQVANDGELKSFTTRLTDRRTQLLTEILGLTPKHPTRQRAEQEIAKIDQDIAKATQDFTVTIRNRLLEKSKADVYQAQSIEQSLADELDKQRQQANHYAKLYNEALVVSREITRIIQQLDKINDRTDFLSIESTAPGFVRLDTPAVEPTIPVAGKRIKILLIFIAAAFGLGIGFPILIDMLDRRIRTPGEIHKLLGFPPIAWVLEHRNKHTQQVMADQMRRMALALERDWHTHKTNYFVLTSVKAGGGTTTLTLELARLLSDFGVHTLAVELNAFKPDSRYNDVDSSAGLTTLLNQEYLDPLMFIKPATEYLPNRLPVGETPEPYLVTRGKLRPLLKQLNIEYDLILLDTPPILLSADAELLGEIAGGILLVVEAEKVFPGELRRAAQLLERLNPPVVGSILNRVKIYQGGGYFSKLVKEYENREKLRHRFAKSG